MRLLFGLLMLTVVPAAHGQATSGRLSPFTLSLSVLTSNVESGSQVELVIVMKNISNHDLHYSLSYRNGLDRAYQYDVRDSSGRAVELLTKKHPEIGEPFHIWPQHVVRPGETDSSGGAISNLYDMTKPGEYTIEVSRLLSDNPKDGVVKSNKITVNIFRTSPPPPPPPQN